MSAINIVHNITAVQTHPSSLRERYFERYVGIRTVYHIETKSTEPHQELVVIGKEVATWPVRPVHSQKQMSMKRPDLPLGSTG